MKRAKIKLDNVFSPGRVRSVQLLTAILFVYLLLVGLEIPVVLKTGLGLGSGEKAPAVPILDQPITPGQDDDVAAQKSPYPVTVSGLVFDVKNGSSELEKRVRNAFLEGRTAWDEVVSGNGSGRVVVNKEDVGACPVSVSVSGSKFLESGRVVVLPCGLTLGSHLTVVGKPGRARPEKNGEGDEMVSQFQLELQGLKVVDGEDPPRILHFNPRLKGDWSGRPVIEMNTCYRMQWGTSFRCEGWNSKADEETVDGHVKCEKWIRDDDDGLQESKTTWWLRRLIGQAKKVRVDWPYPFVEGKLFVLTLSAGLEGYHINVDGRHVTSFPYRTGFTLEDATGLSITGNVDVHSVYAASLPTTHPNFDPLGHLEMSSKWQAPPLPEGPVELFVGILSAGNHFAERMAVRKSWMQHGLIKSSFIMARFFVAVHGRKEINYQVLKEAKFFGDMVIVPYMDHYELVVLKTVAICEYGIRKMAAKYVMKCDDDTFVRVEAVIREVNKVKTVGSFYIGNMNYYHRPLRHGKWAVTHEEWPEDEYPPYANGPGYVVSSNIAQYVVSEFEEHKLRLFKMEDVSMGMWVEQFNSSRQVEYVHSLKFCQFGCVEGYFTAHYQSPRQMICLWDKLQLHGKPQCCNMR